MINAGRDYERHEAERSDFLRGQWLKYVETCVAVDEASAEVCIVIIVSLSCLVTDTAVMYVWLIVYTHTYIHTHTCTHTHMHTHTHTHTYTHTHARTRTHTQSLSRVTDAVDRVNKKADKEYFIKTKGTGTLRPVDR